MKVAAITGPRQASVVDRPDPRAAGSFCLVKITAAPMCTEYKAYRDGAVSDSLGHEAAGVVVEAPAHGRFRVGDRVVVMPQYPCGRCELCQSGDYIHCEHGVDPLELCGSQTGTATYAQQCVKQDWLLLPIPDDIPDDHAAMACCGLGPGLGAMERMGVGAFQTVLVTGLGPVGLGTVINAVSRGASVIGVDSNAYRTRLALELGAREVIHPADPDAVARIRSLTSGRGADAAVDCTAVPEAQRLAVAGVRRRGQVAFVGWGGGIETGNMVPRGLGLHGVWHWNLNHAPKMMRMIRGQAGAIRRLITHTFPFDRVGDAWELQLAGQCGKIVLHPWE